MTDKDQKALEAGLAPCITNFLVLFALFSKEPRKLPSKLPLYTRYKQGGGMKLELTNIANMLYFI